MRLPLDAQGLNGSALSRLARRGVAMPVGSQRASSTTPLRHRSIDPRRPPCARRRCSRAFACLRPTVTRRIRARLAHVVHCMFLRMFQGSLFPDSPAPVPDAEVAATLRAAIAAAGRLPRSADLLLSGVCAEYLVAELRNAGLTIVRSPAGGAKA